MGLCQDCEYKEKLESSPKQKCDKCEKEYVEGLGRTEDR